MKLDLELYRREVTVSQDPRVRLSVIDVGPPDAVEQLVFLHGYAGWAAQWQHQLRFFSDFCRCIAPDLRGHGQSDAPSMGYTMADLLKDLDLLLQTLGVRTPFVLVGHSFGAAVAAEYALRKPECVEKLILTSPSANYSLGRLAGAFFALPTSVIEVLQRPITLVRRSWSTPAHVLKQLYRDGLTLWRAAGVPTELPIPEQPLPRFLELCARRSPYRAALHFYGRTMRYRQLDDAAHRFAAALRALGIAKGDRVMLLLPNLPQFVIAYCGVLRAGAVAVLANPFSQPAEIEREMRDSDARALIALQSTLAYFRDEPHARKPEILIATRESDLLPYGRRILRKLSDWARGDRKREPAANVHEFLDLLTPAREADSPAIAPDDLAVIEYTGGTTELPKGVMLTHRNLVSNAIQVRYWLTDTRDGEALLAVIPFSHSYGMTVCMNLGILIGARLILLPRFHVESVLRAIARYKPSFFPGVPSMYMQINQHPKVRRYRISSVRACVSGAAPLPTEVQEAFERLTKGCLVEGYGLTEASPVTHVNPLHGPRRRGKIGVPLPGTDAKIVDPNTAAELPPGQPGELIVAGPQVMRGYWNDTSATQDVLRNGWLHTGDICVMDSDGYFEFVDRKQNLIHLAGGTTVYPRRIEESLYEHPKVLEAVVLGVAEGAADPQKIKAFVVLKRGEAATEPELLDFCRQRLPTEQVPHLIEFRQELPKTFVGKIWHRALSEVPGERAG